MLYSIFSLKISTVMFLTWVIILPNISNAKKDNIFNTIIVESP